MSKVGQRLIAAAKEAAAMTQHDIDRHMLRSMATSLRAGRAFSFNTEDMADLLDRQAERMAEGFGG